MTANIITCKSALSRTCIGLVEKTRLQTVAKGNELTKGRLQTTQEEMKYALPTQRKIPICQNRRVRPKNHVGNTRIQAVSKGKGTGNNQHFSC